MKITSPARLVLLALATASLTGCDKKETPAPAKPAGVALVAENARSKAFEATVAHLDVGGPVFAFCETEGDPKRVIDALLSMAPQQNTAALSKASALVDPILADLGFANIHATGFSSRIDGKGFVNRSFLYTPGGPAGLLAITGSKNKPFAGPSLAPADTLFLAEGELDGAKLIAVARAVAARIGDGKQASAALEQALTQQLPGAPVTGAALVGHLSGHALIGIRVSTTDTVPTPKGRVPVTDITIALDDRAPLFRLLSVFAAGENGPVSVKDEGDFSIIASKVPAPKEFAHYAPLIALQKSTGRVWISTARSEFDAWTNPAAAKLTAAPAFSGTSAGLASSGTGLAYVAPDGADRIHRLASGLLANIPDTDAQTRQTVSTVVNQGIDTLFPAGGPGYYSASFVTADGLATESRAPISTKPNAYLWMGNGGLVPVAIVGGLASTAIPAFQKVRGNAIEKTLINDARQVSAAANQYWCENAVRTCTLGDLIGRDKFIISLSNGTTISVKNAEGTTAPVLVASPQSAAIKLHMGDELILGNAQYDRSTTLNPELQKNPATDKTTISFDLDTGRPKSL